MATPTLLLSPNLSTTQSGPIVPTITGTVNVVAGPGGKNAWTFASGSHIDVPIAGLMGNSGGSVLIYFKPQSKTYQGIFLAGTPLDDGSNTEDVYVGFATTNIDHYFFNIRGTWRGSITYNAYQDLAFTWGATGTALGSFVNAVATPMNSVYTLGSYSLTAGNIRLNSTADPMATTTEICQVMIFDVKLTPTEVAAYHATAGSWEQYFVTPMTAAVVATSTATASRIVEAKPLTAGVVATSAVSAVRLRESQPLTASILASSSSTASRLIESHPLVSAVAATSTATASRIRQSHPLTAGIVTSSAANATSIQTAPTFDASIAASSVMSALRVVTDHPLDGEVVSSSSVTGDLTGSPADHALTADIASSSAVSALMLQLAHPLSGDVVASSGATADRIRAQHPLIGDIVSQSACAASTLVVGAMLEGMIFGTSTMTAVFEVPASEVFGDATRYRNAEVTATRVRNFQLRARRTAQSSPINATRIQEG